MQPIARPERAAVRDIDHGWTNVLCRRPCVRGFLRSPSNKIDLLAFSMCTLQELALLDLIFIFMWLGRDGDRVTSPMTFPPLA